MVFLAPTWLCTVAKFCRRFSSDTSAQVGRVTARFISSMVATGSIITSPHAYPGLPGCYPATEIDHPHPPESVIDFGGLGDIALRIHSPRNQNAAIAQQSGDMLDPRRHHAAGCRERSTAGME